MNKPVVASVLIVEDDHKLNAAYGRLLASAGHRVAQVYNGQEALTYLEAHGDPDVIVLDMKMPVVDGEEFLQRYQPLTHHRTAVVVFSEFGVRRQVDEAYRLGVTHYVLKARATPSTLLKLIVASVHNK